MSADPEPAEPKAEPQSAPALQFPSWGALTSSFSAGLATTLDYVKETAVKAAKTIEEETEKRLGDFEKERQDFVRQKREAFEYLADDFPDAEPVWKDGSGNEEELRKQILSLSTDKRNFLVEPPAGTDFEFDLMTILPSAMATLRSDPALEKMRFALVPSLIKEKQFWSNYFYRVGLIKQALALSSAKADDNSVGLSEQEGAGDESNTKEFGDDIMAELGGSEEELAEVLAEAAAKGDDATDGAWEAELQDLLKA